MHVLTRKSERARSEREHADVILRSFMQPDASDTDRKRTRFHRSIVASRHGDFQARSLVDTHYRFRHVLCWRGADVDGAFDSAGKTKLTGMFSDSLHSILSPYDQVKAGVCCTSAGTNYGLAGVRCSVTASRRHFWHSWICWVDDDLQEKATFCGCWVSLLRATMTSRSEDESQKKTSRRCKQRRRSMSTAAQGVVKRRICGQNLRRAS